MRTPCLAIARQRPPLLCNDSYREGKMLGWDPVAMKLKA